jgi:hypothetical protein
VKTYSAHPAMLDSKTQLGTALADLKRSYSLSDYEAVDVAWVAVIKLANLMPDKSEHARLSALLEQLPENRVRSILEQPAIDTLLNLEPPLESILSMPHEKLNAERTAKELALVRDKRITEPKEALLNLVKVLKRIRNRRAHGFKTPSGLRDQQILGAAVKLLRAVGEIAVGKLSML